MKRLLTIFIAIFTFATPSFAFDNHQASAEVNWQQGMNVETFWQQYAKSKGGLTWGETSVYPEYNKVKEGDTILIKVAQGPCLMEFFHSRWRRANDVRRWDDSINEYGGCPYVFD